MRVGKGRKVGRVSTMNRQNVRSVLLLCGMLLRKVRRETMRERLEALESIVRKKGAISLTALTFVVSHTLAVLHSARVSRDVGDLHSNSCLRVLTPCDDFATFIVRLCWVPYPRKPQGTKQDGIDSNN